MDETPSVEQEKLAQFFLDVHKLSSHLDYQAAKGQDLQHSLSNWNEQKYLKKEQRFDYVIKAQLPWWLYARNPFWTVSFLLSRAHVVVQRNRVTPDGLELLERLLNLAEFGKPLSLETAYLVRRAIATKKVSRWQAFSLLASNACNTTASGAISPNGVSRYKSAAGFSIALLMVLGFALLGTTVIVELERDCIRGCVVISAVQLMVICSGLVGLARTLTWERSRKARLLACMF